MTVKELKTEAEALGYKLVKKQEYIKFKPCVCGGKRRTEWHHCAEPYGTFYQCVKCGLKASVGTTKKQAKLNWNEAVEKAEREGTK